MDLNRQKQQKKWQDKILKVHSQLCISLTIPEAKKKKKKKKKNSNKWENLKKWPVL